MLAQYPTTVALIVGIVLGWLLRAIIFRMNLKRLVTGTMHIDTSDDKTDRYLMEMSIPMEEIPKKKYIVLEVDNNYVRK